MGWIQKQWKKRVKMNQHTIREENGRRIYERIESFGHHRRLIVWSYQGCKEKLQAKFKEAGREGVSEMFQKMAVALETYCNGAHKDPMFDEWFTECWNAMERAYEDMFPTQMALPVAPHLVIPPVVLPDTTIEEFGADEIEEFGA